MFHVEFRVSSLCCTLDVNYNNRRAIKRAKVPAVKEPVNLMRQDGKRPDGTTSLP